MPPSRKSVPAKSKRAKSESSRARPATAAGANARPTKKKAETVSSRARSTASTVAKASPTTKRAQSPLNDEVQAVLTSLERLGSKRIRDEMGPRYGVFTSKAFGVSMSNMNQLARRLDRNHELAAALWDTGWYEARMLASLIDEPARVTSMQMDRWCGDFDNWGICDTVCFKLFDRTPHAWRKVAQWCARDEEFVKRAGFALLWALTVHDKLADDEKFRQGLVFVLRGARDERHFVKKAVNMALRAIGKRNHALNGAAVTIARRLADSPQAAARWVGKDALRELTSPGVTRRIAARRYVGEG